MLPWNMDGNVHNAHVVHVLASWGENRQILAKDEAVLQSQTCKVLMRQARECIGQIDADNYSTR